MVGTALQRRGGAAGDAAVAVVVSGSVRGADGERRDGGELRGAFDPTGSVGDDGLGGGGDGECQGAHFGGVRASDDYKGGDDAPPSGDDGGGEAAVGREAGAGNGGGPASLGAPGNGAGRGVDDDDGAAVDAGGAG